jgi:hypothetical protein
MPDRGDGENDEGQFWVMTIGHVGVEECQGEWLKKKGK